MPTTPAYGTGQSSQVSPQPSCGFFQETFSCPDNWERKLVGPSTVSVRQEHQRLAAFFSDASEQ